MESIPLEMDDIFGDNDNEEENYPGPLPDLPEELEPSQPDNHDAENAEVLSKLKNLAKGASKNTVRRPIPKLDGTRLTGERGIPILPKLFENIKFKGKGHEVQDLKLIMDKLEHWGHRLFPKLPFDEVLARVEKLGSKKEVQTCIKKMRQDMPILASDFVGEEEDNDEELTVKSSESKKGNIDQDAEDVFDEIMRQEASQKTTQPTVSPVKTKAMLSDEQRERMERNKRLAMEKRLARLGQASKPEEKLVTIDSSPQSQDIEMLNTDETLTKTTNKNDTSIDNIGEQQRNYLNSVEDKNNESGKIIWGSDNDKNLVPSLNQDESMNSENNVVKEKDCETSTIDGAPQKEISDGNTLEITKTHVAKETNDQQTVEELLDHLEDD